MTRLLLIATFSLLSQTALAQTYQPYQQQLGSNTYNEDLVQCQAYADQVSPVQDAAIGAVSGAAGGAALGAVSGALFNGVSVGEGAAVGAAAGGVLGLAGGAYTGTQNQKQILSNCMRGRGHSVPY